MASDDNAKAGPSTNNDEMGLRSLAVEGGHYINYGLAPDEFLVQCPYDPSHRIRHTRIEPHLFRCRNNYTKARALKGLPEEPRIACKYFKYHQIRAKEVDFHEAQCSYKNVDVDGLLEEVRRIDPDREKKEKEKGFDPDAWMTDPEYYEWCPNPYLKPYNPLESLNYQQAVYHPIPTRMSKADKRKWYAQEKERVNRVLSGAPFQETYQQPYEGTERPSQGTGADGDSEDEGHLVLVSISHASELKKKMLAANALEAIETPTLASAGTSGLTLAESLSRKKNIKDAPDVQTEPISSSQMDEKGPIVELGTIASVSQEASLLVPIEGMSTMERLEDGDQELDNVQETFEDVVEMIKDKVEGLKLEDCKSSTPEGSTEYSSTAREDKQPDADPIKSPEKPHSSKNQEKGLGATAGLVDASGLPAAFKKWMPTFSTSPFSLNRLKELPEFD